MPLRKTLARTPAKTSSKTSGKKVAFTAKPQQAQLEEWVNPTDPPPKLSPELPPDPSPIENVKMKRLTLDIPETLHRSIKLQAVTQSVSMVDLLRTLLEEKYGNL